MTVDDSVRKKADELTKGADTPTEKARRLYDFVARNVRYVSISLGVGRYQPHSASDVLQNGYGDCKDKHTLFSAMLRAEGIQSYPVLIDSSRTTRCGRSLAGAVRSRDHGGSTGDGNGAHLARYDS